MHFNCLSPLFDCISLEFVWSLKLICFRDYSVGVWSLVYTVRDFIACFYGLSYVSEHDVSLKMGVRVSRPFGMALDFFRANIVDEYIASYFRARGCDAVAILRSSVGDVDWEGE